MPTIPSQTPFLLWRLTLFYRQWLFPHQAKSSGKFSNEELLSLKREFQHHKDKIHEYSILMDTISRTEGELRESLPLICCRAELSHHFCLVLLVYWGQVYELLIPVLLSTILHYVFVCRHRYGSDKGLLPSPNQNNFQVVHIQIKLGEFCW